MIGGLIAAPSFLYYANGMQQLGTRHSLEFNPFLFVLMALGIALTALSRVGDTRCAYV